MQVLMRGKRVGVERPGRAQKNDSLIAMPEDTSAIGYIKYLGKDLQSSDLRVGMKVCYGKNRHELKLNGADILVMEDDNIYAIVEDSGAEDKKASA